MDSTQSSTTRPLYRGTQIISYVLGVLEAGLLARFALKLLGANPAALFTDMTYTLTEPLVIPFQSVFGVTYLQGAVFEWTTLLAALVYALIAWGVIRLLVMSRSVSTLEASDRLVAQDS